jgi:hypothetical protein
LQDVVEDVKEEDVPDAAEASEPEDDEVAPDADDETTAKTLNTFERAKGVEFDGKPHPLTSNDSSSSIAQPAQIRYSPNGKTCRSIRSSRRACINSALRNPRKFKNKLSP